MDLKLLLDNPVTRRAPKAVEWFVRQAQKVPGLSAVVEREFESMLSGLEHDLKPYRGDLQSHARLPEQGRGRDDLLGELEALRDREESRWRDGYVSGAVYHGDTKHIEFLNRVYALHSQANPLHADIWPSATKFEAEIVSMTAHMMSAHAVDDPDDVNQAICGVVSSGGTESILLAMKAYRDRAREERGITRPEMLAPTTAHAAFDKASQYFGIKMVKVPVDKNFRADVEEARKKLTANTVVVVGSAPAFPHGTIDPIEELSELAFANGVGFHTDCCLGGFVLPFARDLGHDIPKFDFRLRGVTSMSADTHKYGYAAKGTSVVLYRGRRLRHFQYYTSTEWPGGLYSSPTFAGSRPGALSAACWAAMVSIGEEGYRDATAKILETGAKIRAGVEAIDGLKVLGDPLWVIAFGSDEFDIYQVLGKMAGRGWNLNGLHKPPCVHLAVTLRHTEDGVADRFLSDLRQVVSEVEGSEPAREGMAPVYGMAATVPTRGLIHEVLRRYMDMLYRV